jgi:ABC-2 type transport system ATP-binding protein
VEEPAFYRFLSGRRNLEVFARAGHAREDVDRRLARIDEVLELVGLAHAARKRVKAYSQGMRQRLGLGLALLGEPEMLVLDEPTNGLDPAGMREIRQLLRRLADGGTTVFVSSHLLAEVEQVCTHVGVMSAGRLVAQGTLDEFCAEGETRVLVRTPDASRARDVLAGLGLEVEPADSGEASVTARLGAVPPERVVAALVEADVRVRGFETLHANLEQRFVELTGEGFDVVQ